METGSKVKPPRVLVPDYVCRKYRQGARRGVFPAAVLFVDVSGFTTLTESLMQHGKPGAEVLTDLLDGLFQPLVQGIYRRGGFVATFAGDAFTAVFPLRRKNACAHAAAAAAEIRTFFSQRGRVDTAYGPFRQEATIGLAHGDVEWGILGEADALAYFMRGTAFDDAAEAAGHARRGEALAADSLREHLPRSVEAKPVASATGFHLLDAIEIDLPHRPVPAVTPYEDVVRRFYPDAVVDFGDRAEFRSVCPVFVSFEATRSLRRLNAFTIRVLELCRTYGAYFNKLDFGDKGGVLLILVGAPTSYENNVARACDLLLALRASDNGVRWRAGVTYGTVYAGFLGGKERSEYTAIGDVVNVAARLMTGAAWGEILASEATAHEVETAYRWEDRGTRSLKGKSAKVRTLGLLGRARPATERRFDGALSGRRAELDAMRAFAAPLASSSFAGVVHVSGEAGIGKSRLAHEFSRGLSRGTRVFVCPAEELVRRPLGPFVHLLRLLFHVSPDASRETNRTCFAREMASLQKALRLHARLPAVTPILRELVRTESVLAALLGLPTPGGLWEHLDPQGRHENSLIALRAVVLAQSLLGPVVLELEDGQWLDGESRELLQTLVRAATDHPLLVLVTSRLSDDGARADLSLPASTRRLDVDLLHLELDEIEALAATELAGDVDPELTDFLQARTQGNPLFLLQLLLYLQEREMLERKEGTWRLEATEVEVPATVQAVLLARLDRLAPELKAAVKTAAVLGQTFDTVLLSRVLGRDSRPLLTTGEEERIWIAETEVEYGFRHAMLRDVAYEMQLRARLRTLHARAAECMEALYGETAEAHFADLAHHFEHAGVLTKALPYLQRAAQVAGDRFQNLRALELLDRLLALAGQGEEWRELRHDALLQRAGVLTHVGRARDTLAPLEVVREEAATAGDPARRASACLALGSAREELGEYALAIEHYRESLALCRETGDRRGYASARGNLGECYRLRGRFDDALEAYEEALRIDEELEYAAGIQRDLNNIAIIHAMRDEDDEAMERFQKGLRVAQAADDQEGVARALCNVGIMHRRRGRPEEALREYGRALDIAVELGNRRLQAMVTGNLGNLLGAQGRWQQAARYHEQAIETAREIGDQLGVARSTGNLALALGHLRQWDRAEDLYREALEGAKGLGAGDLQVAHLHEYASMFHRRGERESAARHNDAAAALAKQIGYAAYDEAIQELAQALENESGQDASEP